MSTSPERTLLPIDAHVHGAVDRTRVLALRDLRLDEAPTALRTDPGPVSVGLHPWFLDRSTWEEDFARLDALASSGRLAAVGETGLDHLRGPEADLQTRAFLAQIDLAERLRLPLVVHSVRAGSDLLRIAARRRPLQPWILHDWGGSPEQALALSEKTDSVFSFGSCLRRGSRRAASSLAALPLERILVETDDSGRDVEEIEDLAAGIRACPRDALRQSFHRTWNRMFGAARFP